MKTDFHCDKSGLSETFQVITCSCGCFPLDVEHKEDEGGDSAKNEVKLSSCRVPVCDICVCVCVFLSENSIFSVNCWRSQKINLRKVTLRWILFFSAIWLWKKWYTNGELSNTLGPLLESRVPVLHWPCPDWRLEGESICRAAWTLSETMSSQVCQSPTSPFTKRSKIAD